MMDVDSLQHLFLPRLGDTTAPRTSFDDQLANGSPPSQQVASEDMLVVAAETNGQVHPVMEEPQSSSSSDVGSGVEEGCVLKVILEVDGAQPMRSTLASAEDLEALKQEVKHLDNNPALQWPLPLLFFSS